jgi:hypothetical protein
VLCIVPLGILGGAASVGTVPVIRTAPTERRPPRTVSLF